MMRLMERLTPAKGILDDGHALILSVSQHLQQLLNVRHGSCVTRRDMGLPVISPLSLRGEAQQQVQLCRIIKRQIQLFEPRLLQAQVTVGQESHDFLPFAVKGIIPWGHESMQVDLLIRIDSDSIVEVLVVHFQRLQGLQLLEPLANSRKLL